jgi:hypothetical protein
MSFVKLDCSMLNSSIWWEKVQRNIFITALLMAEPFEVRKKMPQIEVNSLNFTGWSVPPGWYGFVPAASVGIIHRSMEEREEGLAAMVKLGEPDNESKSKEFEGRRLVRVNGGFIVLNFMAYRDRDHTAAERQKRWRERKKAGNGAKIDKIVTNGCAERAPAYAEPRHRLGCECQECIDLGVTPMQ